ncbi:MAG TPA: cation diffusion facilitator family transporter [Burkholderiales bacterium]|nr:cation diffusion facilitator family transporter [Burkholderiales bacterium]
MGGHHSHGHDHPHPHPHGSGGHWPFVVGMSLNLAFVCVEAVFGLLAESTALLADAGHNLGDVLALGLAWGGSVLARRLPSRQFTYGLRGSSILAALFNAMLLMLVTGAIAWEAVQRLQSPVEVASKTVIIVALCGILVNGARALLFLRDQAHDMNIRAAFLHLATDALVSLGVALVGLGVLFTGWSWLDPAASLVIAVVIIAGTWGLLRDTLRLSLHAVPPHVDADAVRGYLVATAGVTEIHDLHIWGMSTTETALTVHLVMPQGHPGDAVLAQLCHDLRERYRIGHATIQVETGDKAHPCALAPDQVV